MTINVSDGNSATSSFTIRWRQQGGSSWTTATKSGGSYLNYTWDTPGSYTGEWVLNVTNGSASVERVFTLDNSAPSVSNLNLAGGSRINSDFGSITFDVNDEFSSVSSLSLKIVDGDSSVYETSLDCSDSSCSVSTNFPFGELSSGTEYTLEIRREDAQGNSDTKTVSFVYDDEYQGDTSPEIAEGHKPGVYRIDSSESSFRIPVTLNPSDEDSPITVSCMLNGDTKFGGESAFVSDSDEEFVCEFNPYTRGEMQFDVSLKLQDGAGNTVTHQVGSYYFDISPPTIGNLSAIVGVFNKDFQVSYEAYDTKDVEGLSVAKIHYQVDESTLNLQAGSNVSKVDGNFKVNTSGLSSGKHTVYAWAVDEAGRVSQRSRFEFDFRPDAEPEASISSVSKVNVTAGKSESISADVTNTGQLYIGRMKLRMVSDFGNRSRVVEGLKPGDNESALFSIDTVPKDLGVHTLTFRTESPDASRTVRVVVTANKEQEKKIESKYQEYLEKYNALKGNVTSLKDQGLADFRQKKLEGNTSEFFSDMQAAKSAMNSGDIYMVENHLESIKADYQKASSTFEEVKQAHATAERNELIGMVLFFFVALGGSGLAYIAFFSEEYTLDAEALVERVELLEEPVEMVQTKLNQYEVSLAPVENAVEKVAELIAEEEEEIEEAEEQAFQGFT